MVKLTGTYLQYYVIAVHGRKFRLENRKKKHESLGTFGAALISYLLLHTKEVFKFCNFKYLGHPCLAFYSPQHCFSVRAASWSDIILLRACASSIQKAATSWRTSLNRWATSWRTSHNRWATSWRIPLNRWATSWRTSLNRWATSWRISLNRWAHPGEHHLTGEQHPWRT